MTEQKLKPWQRRVVEEKEVDERLHRLAIFAGTQAFRDLHTDDQALLAEQHDAMTRYKLALEARIKRFSA